MTERACECCGQTLPPTDTPEGVALTALQKEIFKKVQAAGRNGIRSDRLFAAIWTGRDGGPFDKTLNVHIYNINRRLQTAGKRIQGTWGGGKYCERGRYTVVELRGKA